IRARCARILAASSQVGGARRGYNSDTARLLPSHRIRNVPMSEYRIEKDSLGEVRVPADALYGAQTQRAADNFPISGLRFSRRFIEALGIVKLAAARANEALGLLDADRAGAIAAAARRVADGELDDQFVLDVF